MVGPGGERIRLEVLVRQCSFIKVYFSPNYIFHLSGGQPSWPCLRSASWRNSNSLQFRSNGQNDNLSAHVPSHTTNWDQSGTFVSTTGHSKCFVADHGSLDRTENPFPFRIICQTHRQLHSLSGLVIPFEIFPRFHTYSTLIVNRSSCKSYSFHHGSEFRPSERNPRGT